MTVTDFFGPHSSLIFQDNLTLFETFDNFFSEFSMYFHIIFQDIMETLLLHNQLN